MGGWGFDYYCGLLPSVAQPPFPLHEFFPQFLPPPWPLQSFCPLHACFVFGVFSLAIVLIHAPACLLALASLACRAPAPVTAPAAPAPALMDFYDIFPLPRLALYGLCV